MVVLVAAVLWLVYLLPSWHNRHQYDAAQRNAVRLNQALRVLAETSETPDEVRLELNTRTAAAQAKLARQVQSARSAAVLAAQRDEAEIRRVEVRTAAAAARAEAEAARARRATAYEQALSAQAAARAVPAARRARARRRARVVASALTVAGLGLGVWGAVLIVTGGMQVPLIAGVALAALGVVVLHRMHVVQRRAVPIVADAGGRVAAPADVQDFAVAAERETWTPRPLPQPLTAAAGSRAAAVLDQAAARESLRQAALADTMRRRAEATAPPSIDTARRERTAGVDYAAMGHVDDAEIEAHVRRMLERRAVGA